MQTTREPLETLRHRATLRVGLSGIRVRVLGKLPRNIPQDRSPESLSSGFGWHFENALRNRFVYTRETDSEACFGALSDFKTDPNILIRLVADIWLPKKKTIRLRPKIPTKNLHEWGFGEADRADL